MNGTFSDKCRKAGINYNTAFVFRKRHPQYTDEEVIAIVIEKINSNRMKLTEIAKAAGVAASTVTKYKRLYPELTDEELIEKIHEQTKTLKDRCRENNIKYNTYKHYKLLHKGKTYEEIFEHFDNRKEIMWVKETCNGLGLDFKNVHAYKYNHPDKSYIDIIKLYTRKKKDEAISR